MRYNEFARTLVEATAPKVVDAPEAGPVTKAQIEQVLRKNGYNDFKPNGNTLAVLAQIPDGAKKAEFRMSIINNIAQILQSALPSLIQSFHAVYEVVHWVV